MRQAIVDLLAAGRIANLPTVWSNVLTGAVIALSVSGGSLEGSAGRLFIALLAGSLLYTAGCLYNDFYDRHWDAQHKPDRAIPSGRLSVVLMAQLIMGLGLGGFVLSLLLGAAATAVSLLIALFIFIYTRTHKQTPLAIIPMGVCRAGLYLLGLSVVRDVPTLSEYNMIYLGELFRSGALTPYLLPAVGLMSYIAGITLVARSEATNTLPAGAKWLGLILLVSPYLTHGVAQCSLGSVGFVFIAGAVGTMFWMKNQVEQSVGCFVSQCLAGICCVDVLFWLSAGAVVLGLPVSLAIFIVFFGLALLLQRVAPAT